MPVFTRFLRRNGDGNRVKSVLNGQVTRFVGNFYEEKGSQVTKYYYAGAQRIAVRQSGTLSYLFGDHLSSTSVVAAPNGGLRTRTLYKPFGAVRYQSGTLPTEYTFTGQYSHVDDFGLMYYVARWYDPALGRFTQPDTIVPDLGNPLDFDRYSYVRNNPVKYTDPTGHLPKEEVKKYFNVGSYDEFLDQYGQYWADLLWDTDVTWGDEIIWYSKSGEEQRGVLVLFTYENSGIYYPGIWGIQGEFADQRVWLSQVDKPSFTGKHYDAGDIGSFFAGEQCVAQEAGGCWDHTIAWYYVATDYTEIHQEYYALLVAGLLLPESAPSWAKILLGGTAEQALTVFGEHIGWTDSYVWEHTLGGPFTSYLTMVYSRNPYPTSELHLTIPGNDWIFGGN